MEILYAALIFALVAFANWFLKSVFDTMFGKYMPGRNQLMSYIKKFLSLTFKYIFPVLYIVYLFAFTIFDKAFILSLTLMIFTLLLSLVTEIAIKINLRITQENLEVREMVLNQARSMVSLAEILKDHANNNVDTRELIEKQTKIIVDVVRVAEKITGVDRNIDDDNNHNRQFE